MMAPVFRPPLRGVATRNLDDGSLRAPPQEQSTGDGTTVTPDIRAIIVSVLKEMGLAGGGVAPRQAEVTLVARDPNAKGKKGKKGKKGDKVGQMGRPSTPLPPPGRTMPPPITGATAGRTDDQGQKSNDQLGPSPSTLQTGTIDGVQQVTWTKVVGRRERRRTAPQPREQQGSEAAPPLCKKEGYPK